MKIKLLLLLLLLSSACQKIRYEDFPDHEPLLTINSFFGTDSLASMQLLPSQGIGDSPFFEGIEGATVVVWEGAQPVGQLRMIKPGYYQADTLHPQKEKTYTLKVSAPGYPDAEATTSLPSAPTTEAIKITRSPASTADEPLLRLSLKLQDAAGQDYYALKVYHLAPDYGSDELKEYRNPLTVHFLAPINEFYTPFGEVFSDQSFDGKSYELLADIESYSGIEIYIQISKVNEDFYHYFKTYNAHKNYGEQIFSEPQEVYLNVEGGFGIFGGYASQYYKYDPK